MKEEKVDIGWDNEGRGYKNERRPRIKPEEKKKERIKEDKGRGSKIGERGRKR